MGSQTTTYFTLKISKFHEPPDWLSKPFQHSHTVGSTCMRSCFTVKVTSFRLRTDRLEPNKRHAWQRRMKVHIMRQNTTRKKSRGRNYAAQHFLPGRNGENDLSRTTNTGDKGISLSTTITRAAAATTTSEQQRRMPVPFEQKTLRPCCFRR